MKRMRGRNHRNGGGGGSGGGGGGGGGIRHHGGNIPMNRNHVFDSNGPDMRVRGTSQQLFEKYLQMGRDATSSGDRVMAESYFQYAEHYFRILNAMNQAAQQNGQAHQQGSPPTGTATATATRRAPAISRRRGTFRSPPRSPRAEAHRRTPRQSIS
jgi:hypothetical protein